MRLWSIVVGLGVFAAPLIAAQPLAREEEPAAVSGEFGLAGAQRPAPGVLFGGQPTAEQLHQMAAQGYRAVIDLRAVSEERGFDEAAVAKRAGMAYAVVPVGASTLRAPETFERFFELFEQAERPVLVHCASGNRVGALYYAYLARSGTPRAEALVLARRHGLRSEALVEAVNAYLDRPRN